MHLRKELVIILFLLLLASIAAVSASDANDTDVSQMADNDTTAIGEVVHEKNIAQNDSAGNSSQSNETKPVEKTTPTITIGSNDVKSKDTLEIYLKNSSGSPIGSKELKVSIDDKVKYIKTNSEGIATLAIDLSAGKYKLTISFEGDDSYNPISENFDIVVSKLKTKITESANFVVKGKYLYFYVVDSNGNPVSGKKVTIKFNGKTYTKKTNSRGRVAIKIKKPYKRYSIKVKFKGDGQYKASSKKLKFYVTKSMSIKIGNSKMLSNGYIRVYLKVNGKAVSKKVKLFIGGKKLTKKANSEGIAIFKPKVNGTYFTVKAKVGKYYSSKNLKCYDGNVKDPLTENVSYKGKPDIDVMPGNYVMGDNNARYTLTKSQYREVLKRDSYCLFFNDKLTKYTFFKTKGHPKLNHIIKREKWNVIERAINSKLVKKNKYGYWPGKISVSLKGKSYTYPEVRDSQNTGYTCGPTSGSVCSQVLKNYVCEKYLSKLAGTKKRTGTTCLGIKKALEKNNFNCTYYYKASFKDALNELKKGGSALVFHANRHYVAIIDISSNGKKVLVSNSYGSYDNIPTKWVKVSYMKKKFSHWEESLIVKLNYKLSDRTKNTVNCYYNSFGTNWHKHNTRQSIGR
jgi:hypothetical protein